MQPHTQKYPLYKLSVVVFLMVNSLGLWAGVTTEECSCQKSEYLLEALVEVVYPQEVHSSTSDCGAGVSVQKLRYVHVCLFSVSKKWLVLLPYPRTFVWYIVTFHSFSQVWRLPKLLFFPHNACLYQCYKCNCVLLLLALHRIPQSMLKCLAFHFVQVTL